MGKNKMNQKLKKIYKFFYFVDRGILMIFGSGVYGCLGYGNYNDVVQVFVILFFGIVFIYIWN